MTMRFDDYVAAHGLAVTPVDRFTGFFVEVGVPSDWEPFDSALGVRVWACRDDPFINEFCANAVLTMHRIASPLDPTDVFTMLAEQQLQSAPRCRELRRELAAAGETLGVQGLLAMQITHERGAIDSVSKSRIVTTATETIIVQLTVTALRASPVDREHIWLTVRPGATAAAAPADHRGEAPITGTRPRS